MIWIKSYLYLVHPYILPYESQYWRTRYGLSGEIIDQTFALVNSVLSNRDWRCIGSDVWCSSSGVGGGGLRQVPVVDVGV